MPSGPKKRKTARKKKERENNKININNPPQVDNNLKPRNEKASDGRDDNSHRYYENGDIHDQFNDGSEVVHERDPAAARPIASDVVSVEEVCGDFKIEQALVGKEGSVVMIKKDLRSKDGYEKENGRFEHNETAKEPCNESRNKGGISNGESLAKKNSKDEIYNLLEEKAASHELVKPNESSPSNTTADKVNSPVELEETRGNSAAKDSVNSVKTATSVSGVTKCNPGVAPLPEVINLAGKMNEDSVYPLTNEKAASSRLKEPKPKESNSKVLTSSSPSPLTKGAVHTKNSETPEFSKNQPSVRLAPNLVQKTSWWSCCGMFEVLSGSNR